MQIYWHTGVLIWIGIAFVTFGYLYFKNVTAPFGRHSRTDWGPMINNSLGWFIMEVPSLIFLWAGFLYFKTESTPEMSLLPMALWSLHYINRAIIYPIRLRNRKKQMPLVIALLAFFFNFVNGTINGVFLASGWFYQSKFLMGAGLIVFLGGMYINMRSDHILINLRKPGESNYKLPRGFLFERISTPNLFGEILEWFGFFLVAPGLASLSFWIWTMSNLVPRARDHHKWYLEQFPEYPDARMIVFPKIWK